MASDVVASGKEGALGVYPYFKVREKPGKSRNSFGITAQPKHMAFQRNM